MYTRQPSNGRISMNRIQPAFVPPLMSSRRNTSRKHETKIQIAISQMKKNVMAMNQSRSEFTSYLPRRIPIGSATGKDLGLGGREFLVAQHARVVELAELLELLH